MQIATTRNLVLTEFSSLKMLAIDKPASSLAEFYMEIAQKLIRGIYSKESINVQDWKQKMVKEPNGSQKNDESSQELDDR